MKSIILLKRWRHSLPDVLSESLLITPMLTRSALQILFLLITPWGMAMAQQEKTEENSVPDARIVDREWLVPNVFKEDQKLCKAIQKSVEQWDSFERAFRLGKRSHTDFVVVVCFQVDDEIIPVGVKVKAMTPTEIEGEVFLNSKSKVKKYLGLMVVPTSATIDWRYAALLEMQGGWTYRELLGRLRPFSRLTVMTYCPFYIREVRFAKLIPPDVQGVRLAEFIIDAEIKKLDTELAGSPDNFQKQYQLPFLNSHNDFSFSIVGHKFHLAEVAVSFGASESVEWFSQHNWFGYDKNKLMTPAIGWNNLAAVKLLLTDGVPVDIEIDPDFSALEFAISKDHLEIAEHLLERQAAINYASAEKRSSLLSTAKSLPALQLLRRFGLSSDESQRRELDLESLRSTNISESESEKHVENQSSSQRLNDRQLEQHIQHWESIKSAALEALKESDPDQSDDFEQAFSLDCGTVLPIEFWTLPAKR